MWVHINITSRFLDDMAYMHAIRDGLDTTPNDLDQVLEDQGEKINLVAGLDMVHEPVVNLAHHGILQLYRPKK